jgi:hypothetical protein
MVEFVIHFDRINFGSSNTGLHKAFVVLLFSLIILLLLLVIAEMIFFPIGLLINKEEPSISFLFLFSPDVKASITEIVSYNATYISTRGGGYDGIFVNTITGRKYLVSDFNLTEYKTTLAFLQDAGIPDNGFEKFRPFRYIIKYFLLA